MIHVEREITQRTESRKAKEDEEISTPEKKIQKEQNKSQQFTQRLQKGLIGKQSSQLRNSNYSCNRWFCSRPLFFNSLSLLHTQNLLTDSVPLPSWEGKKNTEKNHRKQTHLCIKILSGPFRNSGFISARTRSLQ